MTKIDFSEGIDLLKGEQTIAICGHVNPDGDCLGCVLALTLALRSCCFEVTPLLATRECPGLYDFLEGYEWLTPACDYTESPDVFIMVDVPSLQRIGDGAHVFKRAKKTLLIDHHQGNGAFADVAFIDDTAAAAGMLVWDFIDQSGITLTPEIATCCYTALVTDTGRFQFQNTNPAALRAAADLAQAGANPSEIARYVYQRKSLAAIQLNALVMRRMELLFDGRAVVSWVCEADFKNLGATKDDGDSLIDQIRQLDGIEVAVMLREQGPIVRGSIRSKTDRDVSLIAAKMGGGGHKAAAGFSIKGGLDKARYIVTKLLKESFEERPRGVPTTDAEVTRTTAFSPVDGGM